MQIVDILIFNQPVWIAHASYLTFIVVLGALVMLYNRFACDKPGCYRIARHNVKDTRYRTCTQHLTAADHELLQKQYAIRRPQQTASHELS